MRKYKKISVNGKQVRLHRYVMEQHLKRQLSCDELVHHIDDNPDNNNINNLEIVSRAKHKIIHSNIGKSTRFKLKHNFDEEIILEMYKKHTIMEVARLLGVNFGAVQRFCAKHNLRDKIVCSVCGKRASYVRKQLCVKHYLKEYHEQRRLSE